MIGRWISRRLSFVFAVSPEMHAAIQDQIVRQAAMWTP